MSNQVERFFPHEIGTPTEFHRALKSIVYWARWAIAPKRRPRGDESAPFDALDSVRTAADKWVATIKAIRANSPSMLPLFRQGRIQAKSAFEGAVITFGNKKFASYHDA